MLKWNPTDCSEDVFKVNLVKFSLNTVNSVPNNVAMTQLLPHLWGK